jgi:tetratricopeptide (TPR) repeat protein
MPSAALAEEPAETPDPFSLALPSPLPSPAPASPPIEDAVTTGERLILSADATDDPDARAQARLALADTWLALGLLAPALDLVREAAALAAANTVALGHQVALLPRAAKLREAAEAAQALARANPTTANLLATVRAWLRAEDITEAFRALNELHTRVPDDPQAASRPR